MQFEKHDNVWEIKLPSQFKAEHVRDFLSAFKSLDYAGTDGCALDFAELSFIDSSGIGTMVAVAKELRMNNSQLILRHLTGEIRDLFFDTGLDKIFTVETEEGTRPAEIDIFKTSVDIRLEIIDEKQDDICILHLNGVMNHPMGSRFFKQKFLLAMAHHTRILLDLEELTFFDSLSVSVMLNMNKLLLETGGSMRICGANYIVNDLFSTLSIDQIIPFYATRDEALASWDVDPADTSP